MPRKKPLVENARDGLDSLKNELLREMKSQTPHSYRDRFLSLARAKAERLRADETQNPESPPGQ